MELVHLHRQRLNETPASLPGLEQRLYCASISISSLTDVGRRDEIALSLELDHSPLKPSTWPVQMFLDQRK